MEKKDYLPTHDHFYSWISSKEKELMSIFDEVHGEGNGKWLSSVLNKNDLELEYNFEVSPINDRQGCWDMRAKLVKVNIGNYNRTSVFKHVFIEYKTSIEESNVEEIIRKIKQRHKGSDSFEKFVYVSCLVTFDQRFSKFESIFDNEGISLIVLSDAKRKKIGKEFGEIQEGSEDLSGFLS